MAVQMRPRCFKCREVVEYDPVFEAPCGHEEHSSAVFHGICLMEWREFREDLLRKAQEAWMEEHAEHDPGHGEP